MGRYRKYWPCGYSLLLFLFYLSIHLAEKKLVTHDATLWINYGLQIFKGGLEKFDFIGGAPPFSPLVWTPGYPFLIGLVNLVFRHPVFSAYFVSLAGGALLPVIIYYLSKEFFNIKIAVGAMLLTGFYPPLVQFATSTLIRSTAILLLCLSIFLTATSIKRENIRQAALAGALAGLAILTRFEMGLYFFLGAVYLGYHCRRHKISWKLPVVYLVSCCIIYSLYAIPLYCYSGYKVFPPYLTRVLTGNTLPVKAHIDKVNYAKMDAGMWSALYNNNTVSRINIINQNKVKVTDPVTVKENKPEDTSKKQGIIKSYKEHLTKVLLEIILKPFLFLVLGIVCLVKYKELRNAAWLPALILITLLTYPLTGGPGNARYYSHLIPLILILSSAGICLVSDIIQEKTGFRWAFILGIGLVLAVCLLKDIRNIQTEYTAQEKTWLRAAGYLKGQAAPGSIVLARKHFAAFYSGLRTEMLPDEPNLQDVYEYAGHIGASYLLIDNHFTCSLMPQYKQLLANPLPPNLVVEAEFDQGNPCHTRILEFMH